MANSQTIKKVRIDNKFLSNFSLDVQEMETIKARLHRGASFVLELNGLYAVIDLEQECLHVRRLDGAIKENIKTLDLFLVEVAKIFKAKSITGNFNQSPNAILKMAKKLGYFINPECNFEVMKAV